MINLFEKLSKGRLGPRSEQVHEETISDPKPTGYQTAYIIVQKHDTENPYKRTHFDFRLILPGSDRAISFASPKGLPNFSEFPKLFIKQPDHTLTASRFSGHIDEGYGKGDVSVVHKTKAIYKSIGNKVDLTIPSGELKGRYTLIKNQGKNWLAIKNRPMERHFEEYRSMPRGDESLLDHPDFIAEEKHDGLHVLAHFSSKKGISLTARNKSVMGEPISKEDNFVHLRDFKIHPKWDGTVIRAELVGENYPFHQASSIFLSNPISALEAQNKIGKMVLIPHELIKGSKGVDVQHLPYMEKRAILSGLTESSISPYIKMPVIEDLNKRKVYKDILARGGEGVVLRHKITGESYKLKKSKDLDLRIVGFSPGKGRFSQTGVGAVSVSDRAGRLLGDVGVGLSDKTRQDMAKNPRKYLHTIIRVGSMEITPDGQLRHPKYLGHSDKPVADVVPFEKQALSKSDLDKAQLIQKTPLDIPAPFPEMKVYSVDGEAVRNTFDSDYSQGGNSHRYSWIPKNEIWIDNTVHPHEIPEIILHEAIESRQMASGKDYEHAHTVAKRDEDRIRHKLGNDANPNSQAITSGLDIQDEPTDPDIEYNREKKKRYMLNKLLMQSKKKDS